MLAKVGIKLTSDSSILDSRKKKKHFKVKSIAVSMGSSPQNGWGNKFFSL